MCTLCNASPSPDEYSKCSFIFIFVIFPLIGIKLDLSVGLIHVLTREYNETAI